MIKVILIGTLMYLSSIGFPILPVLSFCLIIFLLLFVLICISMDQSSNCPRQREADLRRNRNAKGLRCLEAAHHASQNALKKETQGKKRESAETEAALQTHYESLRKEKQKREALRIKEERKKREQLLHYHKIATASMLDGDSDTAKCWLYFIKEEEKSKK